MVIRLAAATTALALLAGCSVQRHGLIVPSAAPVSVRPAVTEKASEAPSAIPGTVPSAMVASRPGGPPEIVDRGRLTGALLTPADLPAGWTIGTSKTNQPGQPRTNCPPYDQINEWPGVQAVIGFYSADGGTQLVEGLLVTTPEQAKRMLATARQMIGQCPTITVRDELGNPYVFDLSEPRFARLGDDSYAIRMGNDQVFYDNTIMIRRGGMVLTVASYTEKPDTTLVEPFARQALARASQTLT
ncbi:sensor domain-containing protein [Paractinoplanes globisporus]|uniref:Sensor domain-containing protein n=1 Tax=Paractinoplanes globisporus TaxID=113565 RepID=A0ABW6WA42_9ACTN|nr:sensor domain-containing protein [Actinoplanes globisporus]